MTAEEAKNIANGYPDRQREYRLSIWLSYIKHAAKDGRVKLDIDDVIDSEEWVTNLWNMDVQEQLCKLGYKIKNVTTKWLMFDVTNTYICWD